MVAFGDLLGNISCSEPNNQPSLPQVRNMLNQARVMQIFINDEVEPIENGLAEDVMLRTLDGVS